MTSSEPTCPVCGITPVERPCDLGENPYECPNCGRFSISRRALKMLESRSKRVKAALSHSIWCNQSEEHPCQVSTTHLDVAENERLPNPAEQLERLILYLGNRQEGSVGSIVTESYANMRAKVGAIAADDVAFVVAAAKEKGYLDIGNRGSLNLTARLSLDGWASYEKLKRGQVQGRSAFMAMPFKIPDIAGIVDDVFRPAIREAGFRLRRLDDEPVAGLIDDRIRVEIRMCRFLVADLTERNPGAYWEAGYAEGLGKPVIYTCRKRYFDEHGTHFDTNHRQTVLWDSAQPEKAAEDLKATVRATLPFESVMPRDESEPWEQGIST